MVWRRYGRVVGQLNLFGAVVGAVLFLVVFGFLVPPDRGEESVIVVMPFVGALFGVLTSVVASGVYLLGLRLGTRNPNRSVPSLALIGAGSAAAGAALLWIGVGVWRFGPAGVAIWGFSALFCAALAAAIAGPSTSRAARDAEDAEDVEDVEGEADESMAEFGDSNEARSADRLL